jgi:hypothetical protein
MNSFDMCSGLVFVDTPYASEAALHARVFATASVLTKVKNGTQYGTRTT